VLKYSPEWFQKYGRLRERPISARVRNAFRVESLEPRVLLSADPILLLSQVLPTTYEEQQAQAEAQQKQVRLGDDQVLTSTQLLQSLLGETTGTDRSLASPSIDFSLEGPGATVELGNPALWVEMPSVQGDSSKDILGFDGGVALDFSASPTSALTAAGGSLTSKPASFAFELNPASPSPAQAQVNDFNLSTWEDLVKPATSAGTTAQFQVLQSGGVFDLAQLTQTLTPTTQGLTVSPGAVLKGSGTMQGAVLNYGTFSPGYSPGYANVSAISNDVNSTTQIEIGGALAADATHTGANYFDVISVSGLAALNGQLNVSLWGGYRPTNNQTFTDRKSGV
jgi:hypothetical protein